MNKKVYVPHKKANDYKKNRTRLLSESDYFRYNHKLITTMIDIDLVEQIKRNGSIGLSGEM